MTTEFSCGQCGQGFRIAGMRLIAEDEYDALHNEIAIFEKALDDILRTGDYCRSEINEIRNRR